MATHDWSSLGYNAWGRVLEGKVKIEASWSMLEMVVLDLRGLVELSSLYKWRRGASTARTPNVTMKKANLVLHPSMLWELEAAPHEYADRNATSSECIRRDSTFSTTFIFNYAPNSADDYSCVPCCFSYKSDGGRRLKYRSKACTQI